jgi:hypothetical protein
MQVIARSARAIARRLTDTKRTVAIDRCRHYRGFRYGGFGNNPYEDYIVGLSTGQPINALRVAFVRAILGTRPRTMTDALQVDVGPVPAWQYPWIASVGEGFAISEPAANPDVVCHDCDQGILVSHINREFRWLESAYANIKTTGYKPKEFGFLRCLEFIGENSSSFLVLDGNHRISAMHAIGLREVEVVISAMERVRRSEASSWPQVVNGTYSLTAALAVFDRYFLSSNPSLIQTAPGKLLSDEPQLWLAE